MKYSICKGGEKCSSSNVVYAKDNVCCIGICETKETSSVGKIIGFMILIIIFGVGIWFYKKKYKKAKKPVNLLKVARRKKK